MKFQKDVFTSYHDLDDKLLDNGATGWSIDFHTLLQTQLEQTIGHELNIGRHERDARNWVFASEIAARLPKLKVMVDTINPYYVDSEFWTEPGVFYKAANRKGGIKISSNSRIFKVVKTPVDKEVIESLPNEIHKIFGKTVKCKFYWLNKPEFKS